jgi:hypothetical protein
MPARTWTDEMIKRFKKEYPIVPNPRDLAKDMGITYQSLKSKATVLKLKRKAPMPRYSTATKGEDQFLKENYLIHPEKRMATMLKRSDVFIRTRLQQLGLQKPRWLIEKFIQEARIKPGNIPANKGKKQVEYMSKEAIARTKATRFKKGGLPPTTLYDGCITIRTDHPDRNGKPHKYIRLSKAKWQELQIYNWEKKNGKVPKGFILACKDGDTMNCKPSNWYLMSMADNMKRNSSSLRLTDGYVAFTIAGKNHVDLIPIIKQDKKLIEIKRQSLLLKRMINERTANTEKA